MQSAGMTDLQVNGYAGVDFNSAAITPDAMEHALRAMLDAGVGCCLPTLITATEVELGERFAALDAAIAGCRLGPLMVPGYHLEGPFLNPMPGYAGCHPAAAMGAPDPHLIERVTRGLRRPVLLLTLAPERDGAARLIGWARTQGMVMAMGHTAADADTVAAAAESGVTLSTHLGNALPQPQPKFANPLIAQLAEDRLSASFIADGIHVPRAALKVMLRAKGLERSILVTDATAAAAMPPGLYDFAGMRIERKPDGSVRVPGSPVLAGSGLCLDQAVRNLFQWGLASAEQAVVLSSINPRTLLAPVFNWHGIQTQPTELHWSADLAVEKISLGSLAFFPAH